MAAESPSNYGACPSHCCVRHGCKYDYEGCPVVAGTVAQEHACPYCGTFTEMSWVLYQPSTGEFFNDRRRRGLGPAARGEPRIKTFDTRAAALSHLRSNPWARQEGYEARPVLLRGEVQDG